MAAPGQTNSHFATKRKLAMQLLRNVSRTSPKGFQHITAGNYIGKMQILENGNSLCVIIDVDPQGA